MTDPYRKLAAAVLWRALLDLNSRSLADDARRWLTDEHAHNLAAMLDVDQCLANFNKRGETPTRGLKRWTVSRKTHQGELS